MAISRLLVRSSFVGAICLKPKFSKGGPLNTATAYQRFATFASGVFGWIRLLLAAAGVFSVDSYAVTNRAREFGIRMALGVEPRGVLRLVLPAQGGAASWLSVC
jgi:ABC-type antimicrobial peptide transport system permease subunit